MDREVKKVRWCPVPGCGFFVNNLTAMQRHASTVHQNRGIMPSGKLYSCQKPDCNFSTPDRTEMIQHILWHDPFKRIYHCEYPDCKFASWDETEILTHFNAHDLRRTNWYCPLCGAMYAYDYDASLCCSENGKCIQICRTCHGYRDYKTSIGERCPDCGGSGMATSAQIRQHPIVKRDRRKVCPACNGSGKGSISIFKCKQCRGTGKVIDDSPLPPVRSLVRYNGYMKEYTPK